MLSFAVALAVLIRQLRPVVQAESRDATPPTLKRCLLSSSRGSILVGARYPWHTTKISAEVLRDAAGLVASTFSNSCLKAYSSEL